MEIRLVRPDITHKDKAAAFRQEFFDNSEFIINGSELLDKTEDYEEWLTRNTDKDTVSEDWVVTDTFFAVDDNDDIVGIIDLRHELNDFLADFGHCGYSVRPSMRRNGIGAKMLELLCAHAKAAGMESLQLSVERSNETSVRIIKKCGGLYVRSFEFENEQADIYEIKL